MPPGAGPRAGDQEGTNRPVLEETVVSRLGSSLCVCVSAFALCPPQTPSHTHVHTTSQPHAHTQSRPVSQVGAGETRGVIQPIRAQPDV